MCDECPYRGDGCPRARGHGGVLRVTVLPCTRTACRASLRTLRAMTYVRHAGIDSARPEIYFEFAFTQARPQPPPRADSRLIRREQVKTKQ